MFHVKQCNTLQVTGFGSAWNLCVMSMVVLDIDSVLARYHRHNTQHLQWSLGEYPLTGPPATPVTCRSSWTCMHNALSGVVWGA